ncbi:uncharacterized protein Z518_03061 [Rhinocladiella mackenziei CBS 650.93]|uniref:Uncharacterized protein n=1 Tax=Rhinocladiella mackenziei CBS 650.93 TaxID=1442369 RepID=A0A0D2JGE3_9EURO|nr:uncharacterized protein Z518_03061 [Rhinocladiella mackenziei CBS 650.93]KIX08405.1 hypothetical protein Z518_03061 [Rhinocladiella mackenziei CBS 650.93]
MSEKRTPEDLPDPLTKLFVQPLLPALGVGTATGCCGVAYGRIAAILISSPTPGLYTALSGAQWFCAGSAYFCMSSTPLNVSTKLTQERDCRSVMLGGPLSRDNGLHRVAASSISGAVAGAVAAKFVPRGAVVSGSIMFGILAAVTQTGLNSLGDLPPTSKMPSVLKQGVASLIPMKALSDKEYEDLLQDKILKIEAEISILDDQIAELRTASRQLARSEAAESKDDPR